MPTVELAAAGSGQLIRAAVFLQPQTTDAQVEEVTYGNALSTISLDDRINPASLAISLGAPFWFDMLKKVISIRGAGKSPSEEKESKAKA